MSDSESYLEGLVCMGHWQDFVSRVDAAQFAERAEQPLARPTIELQFLVVMLRTGQNLRSKSQEMYKLDWLMICSIF